MYKQTVQKKVKKRPEGALFSQNVSKIYNCIARGAPAGGGKAGGDSENNVYLTKFLLDSICATEYTFKSLV